MNRNSLLTAGWTLFGLTGIALADGSEALGPPSIALPQNAEVVLGGVGLLDGQPGSFSVLVPNGRTVQQVLAYWEGLDSPGSSQGATDDILINGAVVTGDRIGGATNFFNQYYTSAYRADVTSLGFVAAGTNDLTVEGLDYTYANNGLGLVVLLDDGERLTAYADGLDYAHGKFQQPYTTTEPVVYTFAADDEARQAQVNLLVTGVEDARPNVIEVLVDGVLVVEEIDLMHGNLGHELDGVTLELTVPAGATEVSVQLLSEDRGGPFTGSLVSSLTWLFSSFSIEAPADDQHGCDPCWWKQHWWKWDPWCTQDNLTQVYDLKDDFNKTFGVKPWDSGVWPCTPLYTTLCGGGHFCGWNYWRRVLNSEATAALLNADSDFGYPFTVAEVKAIYRDAIGADCGPETLWTALDKFHDANRLGCPCD